MIRRICLAFGLAMLCLHASAAELPLPVAPQLPIEIDVRANTLEIDNNGGAAAAGFFFAGVAGAMIATAVQSDSADSKATPIYRAFTGYEFDQRAEAIFRARLASDGISPAPSVARVGPWDAPGRDRSTMPPLAMVISPRYVFFTDFEALIVQMHVEVVERSIRKNGKLKEKRLFQRDYSYHFPLRLSDDRATDWARMGSPRLPSLVDQGLSQLADMLVYDLSAEGRKESRKIMNKPGSTLVKGKGYPGWPVRRNDNWTWLRSMDGARIALSGYQPINAHEATTAETAAIPEALRAAPATTSTGGNAPAAAPAAGR